MDILILTAFVSLVLVFVGLWFFVWNHRQGTHEHGDRLVLLPLAEDSEPLRDNVSTGEPS